MSCLFIVSLLLFLSCCFYFAVQAFFIGRVEGFVVFESTKSLMFFLRFKALMQSLLCEVFRVGTTGSKQVRPRGETARRALWLANCAHLWWEAKLDLGSGRWSGSDASVRLWSERYNYITTHEAEDKMMAKSSSTFSTGISKVEANFWFLFQRLTQVE